MGTDPDTCRVSCCCNHLHRGCRSQLGDATGREPGEGVWDADGAWGRDFGMQMERGEGIYDADGAGV